MPGWAIALIVVPCVLGLDLLLFTTLMRAGWAELTQGFHAVPPEPNAVRRNFQTFRAGMYSFGACVHVAVDENRLHLIPARLIRWCGAKPASIPWGSITLVKPGKRHTRVKIRTANVTGPTWCLELATPPAP